MWLEESHDRLSNHVFVIAVGGISTKLRSDELIKVEKKGKAT